MSCTSRLLLAAAALLAGACDMALVSVEAEVSEVCSTVSIPSFGPRSLPEGMEVDVELAALAGLDGDLVDGLETHYQLRSAGFLAASDVDSLGFLDRLELRLEAGGAGQLPSLSLIERSFDADPSPVVVSDFAPSIDVTDYVTADDSALRVAIDGEWQDQEWGADLDLCFAISAGYEL